MARMIYDLRQKDKKAAFDGLEFLSRHGNELRMWAVFERGTDGDAPANIKSRIAGPVDPDNEDLARAVEHLGLSWPQEP
jgi:hypothetical protein